MKPLPAALDEYLALRRSLGYKLCEEGHLLRQFVAFARERGAEFITSAPGDRQGVGGESPLR